MNDDGNRKSSHPLRMMAADYDIRLSSHDASRHLNTENPRHYNQRANFGPQRGKGKGHRRPVSRTGTVEDFMLPEMMEDPWIDLYARLSHDARETVTRHLTEEERHRMERNLVDSQVPKRPQIGSSSNSA